jgi:outer membrane protein assembly factor BamB
VVDPGTLAVHDPATGERRRELGSFGERIDVAPAVADGTAYVGGDDGLAAVSLADGTVEWSADVTVTAGTGRTVGRDAVVAPVTDGPGVVAFERSGGGRRWEYQIDGFDAAANTSATLTENAAFVVTNDSTGVVALGDLPTSSSPG